MTTLLTFLLFTGTVAFISWRMTRGDDYGTSSGFFLAGRGLTWLFIGGSLLLTNLSTEQIVGLNGGAHGAGMQMMGWEVFAGLSMIFMALVMLPKYLRNGVTTVSEFLEKRYDPQIRLIVAILLILSLYTNLMPFVLYSGALFMREVFSVPEALGVSEDAAVWMILGGVGVVGAIYPIFGGLKAGAVSDTLNGVGLFVGGLAIPILGLVHLGGDEGFFGGIRALTENHKEALDPIHPPKDPQGGIPAWTLLTGMIFINFYYWCTNQAIVQRTFGAKSLAHGQKGLLFAASMKMLGPFYLVLPGIIALHLFGSGIDGDEAYGMLVNKVLPAWMAGFFAAVIFGAVLSSFNSGLNSAMTLFSVDLYQRFRPGASEKDMIKVGKIFGICSAIVCVAGAPLIAKSEVNLFDLMKQFASLYNTPLIVITAVGIFLPRVPNLAAYVVLVFGFAFYIIFGFIQKNTIFGHELHWLHVTGINGYLCILIMVVFGIFAPRKLEETEPDAPKVDMTPWQGAKVASAILAVVIVGIYVVLHFIANS
ncbi:MAG: solute:sodium symporter family transporter [Verrucomicrobiota bacterium]